VEARIDRGAKRIAGATDNALVISLDVGAAGLGAGVGIDIDGTTLRDVKPGRGGVVRLARDGEAWKDASSQGEPRQVPGPFKRAFENNFVLVYATRGTTEENAHALAQARFHAETWLYRGNGSCDVIADDEFDANATENRDRNVIVYGNAQINSAYASVVPDDAQVSITRGRVIAGERRIEEDLLGVMFVCRRRGAGDGGPLVGVVGGTSAHGLRSLDRAPIFTSGVGFPDVLVVGADMLQRGADGIRTIGFYGPDGSLKSGDVINQKGFDMPGDPMEGAPE
jgi:hypothetical protein